MTVTIFSRWWRDPSECVDEIRDKRERCEKFEVKLKEQELRRKRRHIRKVIKAAKAREGKGQR